MLKKLSCSVATKITLGFIFVIIIVGIAIFFCCEYYSFNRAKNDYKHTTETSARSAAYILYNMPVEKYLKYGKDEQYREQFNLLRALCQSAGLKYLYVYVPDFEHNKLTTIFYLDGLQGDNVHDRDLGKVINWQFNPLEIDAYKGIPSNKVFIIENQMGHTITKYAAVFNSKGKPIALVGADLDYNKVTKKIMNNIIFTLSFIFACLFVIWSVFILILEKVFIKPVMKISKRMATFIQNKQKPFKPLKVKSKDEIGIMAQSFNKMVLDINSYIKRITDTQMETIFSLAKLAQSRDDDTGRHLERVQQYCRVLSEQLAQNSPYSTQIDKQFIDNLVNASTLHDIGKVGVSDLVLLKQGKLTDEEFEQIKKHTIIGYETLKQVHSTFGTNAFIEMGMTVALSHHERFDGKGYPYGIKGEEIPLAARIMALADVYDALSTKRVYKPAFDQEKCVEIIKEGKGTQFDPVIVDAFLEIQDKFYDIRCNMKD